VRTASELCVFDAAGRLVKRLASGMFESGTHVRHWDGIDNAGRKTAAGIYVYRLVAGGRVLKITAVLAR
jgi:flagellar hook assembly protein FlgD